MENGTIRIVKDQDQLSAITPADTIPILAVLTKSVWHYDFKGVT